ncbi:hypothetical protein AAVH_06673 [Aphelenchoides avenae]|nr:hypothetical protein AAVH_06673 [Aphelenchus avenae]
MGRKSSAKRTATSASESVPTIIFKDGTKTLRATAYFHMFSKLVKDYLDQMKPPFEPGTSEIRVPLPETTEFSFQHLKLMSDFLETFKREERGWYKKCFGPRPIFHEEAIISPPKWVFEFGDRLTNAQRIGVLNAAMFFDVPVVQIYFSAYMAAQIADKLPSEMRKILNCADDWTPEDYEEAARDPVMREVLEEDGHLAAIPSSSGLRH